MSVCARPRPLVLALVLLAATACGDNISSAVVDARSATIADLRFAVVGDTRPVNEDDTANYPTAIITAIWADVAASTPEPTFAVSTGDYMFANPTGHEQDPQLDLYLGARARFTGSVYAAMGNHECTGSTTSNCGPDTADGVTSNYAAFVTRMVSPLGVDTPWYVIHLDAADATWTAKLVVIAANAWTDAQARWLDAALSEPTTYTFVVRHEPHTAGAAPGVDPSSAIVGRHPLTLLIVGHVHTYVHDLANHEVIIGNGGAPLLDGVDYGYAIVDRRADAAIELTAYDYQSHAVIDTFAVDADGSPVP